VGNQATAAVSDCWHYVLFLCVIIHQRRHHSAPAIKFIVTRKLAMQTVSRQRRWNDLWSCHERSYDFPCPWWAVFTNLLLCFKQYVHIL